MNIKFGYFPGGRRFALTMSYDDGVTQDRRLVELFNKYGIKGTFHLNSGHLGKYERNIAPEEVEALYRGHEVSLHSVNHPYLETMPATAVISEIVEDRRALEALCGYPVVTMSYPFGTYSPALIEQLRALGVVSSRTVRSTGKFNLPDDFLEWHPTCHHSEGILEKLDKMKRSKDRMKLLYIWGHAYELDQSTDIDSWEMMEEFCKRAGGDPDIWYATNIEIYEYVTAMRALRLSVDCSSVYNPSAVDVWVNVDGKPVIIPAGKTVALREHK